MKFITWNCNGAFRKKRQFIEDKKADILVIQECEDPARSTNDFRDWAGVNYLWYGKNKNKGIGIFPLNGNTVEAWGLEDNSLELFLPCKINGSIPLVAVWTKHANSPNFRYIGQLWKYLQIHKEIFKSEVPIITGDLNSNVIWDEWDRWWNHSDVVRELEEIGIYSLYHSYLEEEQGKETKPTLFMHRQKEKPYHIDYAFVSAQRLSGATIKVGDFDSWIEHSDHMPVEFEIIYE